MGVGIEELSKGDGNKDNYIVSNEFEIRPDPTMDCRVAALDQFKKSFIREYSKYFGDLLSGTTFPKSGQTVVVHYTGKLENGTVFDSSRDRGQPFQFVLGKGQVIKGWEDCIPQMSLGQRVMLTCPSNLGYGKRGFPGVIPPDATLIFDIELIKIS